MSDEKKWWACVGHADGRTEVHDAVDWDPLHEIDSCGDSYYDNFTTAQEPLNDARKVSVEVIHGSREQAEVVAQSQACVAKERWERIEALSEARAKCLEERFEERERNWERTRRENEEERERLRAHIGSPEWEAELALLSPQEADEKRRWDMLWKTDPFGFEMSYSMRWIYLINQYSQPTPTISKLRFDGEEGAK